MACYFVLSFNFHYLWISFCITKGIKINIYAIIFLFIPFIFSFGQEFSADPLKNDSLIKIKISDKSWLIKADSIKMDSLSITKFYKTDVLASYYAKKFNGRQTASGEIFSHKKFTAAHKKLPFGTKLLVTNVKNGKSVIVTVNDRGPFGKGKEIDLSNQAFLEICNHKNEGLLKVHIEIVE